MSNGRCFRLIYFYIIRTFYFVSNQLVNFYCGSYGTRTRDLPRDRRASTPAGPMSQNKSVKGTFYLRPRIHVKLNFTNPMICNSKECQVATHMEPFTASYILLRPCRTRTSDLRPNADALTTELTAADIIVFCFSLVDRKGLEPLTPAVQVRCSSHLS